MADNTTPKVEAKSNEVEASNKKNTGDVLMLVTADYIEHNGVGLTKGAHLWMDESSAKVHSVAGSCKRVA